MLQEFNAFVMSNGVLFGISVAIISGFVNELVGSFINDIIFPIIDRDGDKNNTSDLKERLRQKTIEINGITFRHGSFIYALIRFSLLVIILVLISYFITRKK